MTSRAHQIYNIVFEHGFAPPPLLNNVKKNCTFLTGRLPLMQSPSWAKNFYGSRESCYKRTSGRTVLAILMFSVFWYIYLGTFLKWFFFVYIWYDVLPTLDVRDVDDDDICLFWPCDRIQSLDADTLSVLIASRKNLFTQTATSTQFLAPQVL